MRKFKQVKRKEIVYGVDEWKVIEERAAVLSIKTGTYIKRVSLENQIVCYELKEAVPLLNALRIIGGNINQIARKANEINNIYASDIEELRKDYSEICLMLSNTYSYKTKMHISPCKFKTFKRKKSI
jgi:hypothetical protein